jgi:hypothetical protein
LNTPTFGVRRLLIALVLLSTGLREFPPLKAQYRAAVR